MLCSGCAGGSIWTHIHPISRRSSEREGGVSSSRGWPTGKKQKQKQKQSATASGGLRRHWLVAVAWLCAQMMPAPRRACHWSSVGLFGQAHATRLGVSESGGDGVLAGEIDSRGCCQERRWSKLRRSWGSASTTLCQTVEQGEVSCTLQREASAAVWFAKSKFCAEAKWQRFA